ncbi:hypothetical protein ACJX0J_035153, partial [Zea mays]
QTGETKKTCPVPFDKCAICALVDYLYCGIELVALIWFCGIYVFICLVYVKTLIDFISFTHKLLLELLLSLSLSSRSICAFEL